MEKIDYTRDLDALRTARDTYRSAAATQAGQIAGDIAQNISEDTYNTAFFKNLSDERKMRKYIFDRNKNKTSIGDENLSLGEYIPNEDIYSMLPNIDNELLQLKNENPNIYVKRLSYGPHQYSEELGYRKGGKLKLRKYKKC